jgi:hypothetical protein
MPLSLSIYIPLPFLKYKQLRNYDAEEFVIAYITLLETNTIDEQILTCGEFIVTYSMLYFYFIFCCFTPHYPSVPN